MWWMFWGVMRAKIPAPEMPGRVLSLCACPSVQLPPSPVIYTALANISSLSPLIQIQVDLNEISRELDGKSQGVGLSARSWPWGGL